MLRFLSRFAPFGMTGRGSVISSEARNLISMIIEYLSAHPEFIPALARWHHDQWSYLNPSRLIEDRIEEFQQEKAQKQIPATFVAMAGKDLLGSASLAAHDMDTMMHLTPWLASVYVDPRNRQQGIGSALVQRVVEEAKDLGVETLYLFTPDREKFYKRLGWFVLELAEYRGENTVIMALKISAKINKGRGRK